MRMDGYEHQREQEREREHDRGRPLDGERRESAPAPDAGTARLYRAAAAGRADVAGAAGLSALQRAVGNGAVGTLVQRQKRAGAPERAEPVGEEQRSPVHDVIASGGGAPLDAGVRADLEGRMGADFSDVRVHTGTAAHESAKGVGAHAYTVGNNVVFQRDAYDPSSPQGRTTLAHELTHVIQQRNGPVDGSEAPGGIRVSDPSDRFEREAVANADRVLSAPATAPPAAAGPSVQRAATEDEEERPADVQGSFVQRTASEGAEEEESPPE
ncbi:eCIS core domain-containing protein [Streptomyces inusitatus]